MIGTCVCSFEKTQFEIHARFRNVFAVGSLFFLIHRQLDFLIRKKGKKNKKTGVRVQVTMLDAKAATERRRKKVR